MNMPMTAKAFVSTATKTIVIPDRPELSSLFSNCPVMDYAGVKHRVIPHRLDTTTLLQHLGFKVPNPMLSHYEWCGGTPFDVQKKTCDHMTLNPRCYVLNDMGTGKTKAALWAFDYLRS